MRFEAQAKADRFGVRVIVGEEVKTDGQGEVIGLFLKEKIPRGLSLAETIERIRRQDGVVYVPHPFDRMHSVPDYEHLLTVLDQVDAIEIFNPRVAISAFNEEADRFAAKYRVPAGAGSDAHVPQGLGSVRVRMADFDGPREFLAVAARRGDPHQAVLAAVRAGAEVPADTRHATLGAAGEPGPAAASSEPRGRAPWPLIARNGRCTVKDKPAHRQIPQRRCR